MQIKILGSGCANCISLEKNTRAALASLGKEDEFIKVTDFGEIVSYGIMRTPGLVVDEKVVLAGRVAKPAEIAVLLLAL